MHGKKSLATSNSPQRWESLRNLADGTLGREVAKFYDARGFVFPGRSGSAPPLLAQHDWVHVLADYGSTVESEIEVFGFIARANDDPRAFSLLAQVVSLFETGYTASGLGLFQYDRGHLSHEGVAVRLADALRRGALSAAANHSIDFLTVDWFEHAETPIDEVRDQLGIVPKDARAIESGSATPWGPGASPRTNTERAAKPRKGTTVPTTPTAPRPRAIRSSVHLRRSKRESRLDARRRDRKRCRHDVAGCDGRSSGGCEANSLDQISTSLPRRTAPCASRGKRPTDANPHGVFGSRTE